VVGGRAVRGGPGLRWAVSGRSVGGRIVGGRSVGGRVISGRSVGGRIVGGRVIGGRIVSGPMSGGLVRNDPARSGHVSNPHVTNPAAGGVRVAAIDCGTNSLRLLIADMDPGQATLADVVRRMEIVRLGQGVDATGSLAPDALARTFRVLEEYARIVADASASATPPNSTAGLPGSSACHPRS